MRRKYLVWIAAAALAATGLGAWTHQRGRPGTEYRIAPVRRGAISSTVSATGNLNAVITVDVGSQVSGNVKELYANFNTQVRKDQLVARIDPEVFQAKVNQLQANLEAARAAVLNAQAMLHKNQAEAATAQAAVAVAQAGAAKEKVSVADSKGKYDRRMQLFQGGLISSEDRETAQATYDAAVAAYNAAESQVQSAIETQRAAEAQVEVARTQVTSAQAQVQQNTAELRQAQIDLDHTFIRAPVDGVVVSRQVSVGQTVAASLQAPTLFQIAQDLTKMQVDTNVDEADIGRVQLGQDATFTVDAFPGTPFRGRVVEIRKAPINVQNVITYDVVVAVPNPDLKLLPGMTANVKILTERKENVLEVPNAALRFRPKGADPAARKGPTLWVLNEQGRPTPVTVTAGLSDGQFTEVSGLAEGTEVITGQLGGVPQQPGFSAPRGRPF